MPRNEVLLPVPMHANANQVQMNYSIEDNKEEWPQTKKYKMHYVQFSSRMMILILKFYTSSLKKISF